MNIKDLLIEQQGIPQDQQDICDMKCGLGYCEQDCETWQEGISKVYDVMLQVLLTGLDSFLY